MEYSVNEKQIQRDLQMLIDKGGLNKTYARMAARRATEVVDDVVTANLALCSNHGCRGAAVNLAKRTFRRGDSRTAHNHSND